MGSQKITKVKLLHTFWHWTEIHLKSFTLATIHHSNQKTMGCSKNLTFTILAILLFTGVCGLVGFYIGSGHATPTNFMHAGASTIFQHGTCLAHGGVGAIVGGATAQLLVSPGQPSYGLKAF